MKLWMLSLFVFIASCAHQKSSQQQAEKSNYPEWVGSPQSSCDDIIEICASASGADSSQADANAKKSLASYFKSRIKAEFSSYQSMEQKENSGKVEGSAFQAVSESVDQVLSGVFISQRFEFKGEHFSYAKLDKRVMSGELASMINEVDEKIRQGLKRNNRLLYKSLKDSYEKRNALHRVYAMVKRFPIQASYDLADIEALKYGKQSEKRTIHLATNPGEAKFSQFLVHVLSSSGHRVIAEGQQYDYDLKIAFEKKKEFLKVDGFEKWTFKFRAESFNLKKENVGAIHISRTVTARSEEAAVEKVRNWIEKQIEEKIEDLNIM